VEAQLCLTPHTGFFALRWPGAGVRKEADKSSSAASTGLAEWVGAALFGRAPGELKNHSRRTGRTLRLSIHARQAV